MYVRDDEIIFRRIILMITAGDFRNGMTFEYDGNVCQVVEFQHVKPGKGAAFVRTKFKNVITGAVVEKSFNPTEKFEKAMIERRDMEYLYNDGDLYYFMDPETYEQVPLSSDQLGDALKFVKENMSVKFCSFKGNVFSIEPPHLLSLRLLRQSPALRATPPQMLPSPQLLRQGLLLPFPCLLMTVIRSGLTHVPVSTWREFSFLFLLKGIEIYV